MSAHDALPGYMSAVGPLPVAERHARRDYRTYLHVSCPICHWRDRAPEESGGMALGIRAAAHVAEHRDSPG